VPGCRVVVAVAVVAGNRTQGKLGFCGGAYHVGSWLNFGAQGVQRKETPTLVAQERVVQ
jgi:hypothetical protein